MSDARFHISETNPNDQIGGGGCVCSDSKSADCRGPFAVFYGCETDSNVSPHVVVSLACAQAIVDRAGREEGLATSSDVLPPLDEVDEDAPVL